MTKSTFASTAADKLAKHYGVNMKAVAKKHDIELDFVRMVVFSLHRNNTPEIVDTEVASMIDGAKPRTLRQYPDGGRAFVQGWTGRMLYVLPGEPPQPKATKENWDV